MSLTHMGRDADDVSFLDEINLTFSLDNRVSASQQMTSIELNLKPIVFRASYRDIRLILTIFNAAMEAYSVSSGSTLQVNSQEGSSRQPKQISSSRSKSIRQQSLGQAAVLVSREQV